MSFVKIRDFNPAPVAAGFVAALVGVAGGTAVVFQAMQALGATSAQITSCFCVLGVGVGLCTLAPSLLLRMPVMVAWSVPGAAVLASAGLEGGFSINEAVGAFIASAALILITGVTRWFERAMNRIPMEIASALLAGVLAKFGMQAFSSAETNLGLALVMLGAYLIFRRMAARYAVIVTLLAGMAWAGLHGQMQWSAMHMGLAQPVFMMPRFTFHAFVSLALPLFIVTMTSQNLPGVAVIRTTGYEIPVSGVISLTGLGTLVVAPFGGHAMNLSAMTAAICMGPQAHEDKSKRYIAAAVCGLIYTVMGIFGGVVTGLLTAFPKELVACIAGLALLGAIGAGLATAFEEERHREAALITFLVTLSGVVLVGIGSAFWGVAAGCLALFVQHVRRK